MKKRYLIFVMVLLLSACSLDNDVPTVEIEIEDGIGAMDTVIDTMKEKLSDAGLSYYFDEYPGVLGTLCVFGQYGTSHGQSTNMAYVAEDGTKANFVFPNYGFGAEYYVAPREISFDENGENLTFTTQIIEGDQNGTTIWHNVVCTFDTVKLEMISMEAVG